MTRQSARHAAAARCCCRRSRGGRASACCAASSRTARSPASRGRRRRRGRLRGARAQVAVSAFAAAADRRASCSTSSSGGRARTRSLESARAGRHHRRLPATGASSSPRTRRGQSLQEVALDGRRAATLAHARHAASTASRRMRRTAQRIVFASDRSGNVDLWELALGSGRLRRLTDHGAVDWDPGVSADGKRAALELRTAAATSRSGRRASTAAIRARSPPTASTPRIRRCPATARGSTTTRAIPRRKGCGACAPTAAAPRASSPARRSIPRCRRTGEYVVYQRPEEAGTSAIDVLRVADGAVLHARPRTASLRSGAARAGSARRTPSLIAPKTAAARRTLRAGLHPRRGHDVDAPPHRRLRRRDRRRDRTRSRPTARARCSR